MSKNVTFPLGNVALIDKIDFETGFFKAVIDRYKARPEHSYRQLNC
jgi:hypothetical protein